MCLVNTTHMPKPYTGSAIRYCLVQRHPKGGYRPLMSIGQRYQVGRRSKARRLQFRKVGWTGGQIVRGMNFSPSAGFGVFLTREDAERAARVWFNGHLALIAEVRVENLMVEGQTKTMLGFLPAERWEYRTILRVEDLKTGEVIESA